MSDPVSNREIEDVLSSIRRLVSVEKRGDGQDTSARHDTSPGTVADHAEDASQDRVAADADDDKLVLTPSFRVMDTHEEPEDMSGSLPERGEDSLSLEQWHVSPADTDAESAASSDTGNDDSEAEPQQAASQNEEEASAQTSDHADAAQEVQEDDEHMAEAEAVAEGEETGDADRELEKRIAEVEAAVAAQHDDWETEAEGPDDYYAQRAEPLPWEDYTSETYISPAAGGSVDDPDWAEAREDKDMSPDTDPQQEDDPSQDATSTEAEILAAMRKSRTEALSRSGMADVADNASEETIDFASSRGRDISPDEGPPGQEMQEDTAGSDSDTGDNSDGPTDWYKEDAILDEDALRDLVADIVRQELQGTLGERITRNVRKLVRREIHRAMIGQDFD